MLGSGSAFTFETGLHEVKRREHSSEQRQRSEVRRPGGADLPAFDWWGRPLHQAVAGFTDPLCSKTMNLVTGQI